MADTLVFLDGFDYYTNAEVTRRYTGSTGAVATFQSGRFGGQALRFTTTGTIDKSQGFTSQSWRFGFALNLTSQTGSTFSLISLKDGGTTHIGLSWIATTRNFQFNRNGTLVGSAGATTLSTATWYWIEVYFTISNSISLGQCQLYINGVQEINLAATSDTQNGGSAQADRWSIAGAAFWTYLIDDLCVYSMDTTTTPTFIGDFRVQTLYPDGNGNYSQFTGSDGNSTNNYLLVDDTTTGDSDYVEDATVSDRDSYTYGALSGTIGTIKGVQIVSQMKTDDAGAKTAKLFYRISSTDYDGSSLTPTASFAIKVELTELSPATSSAWTSSEVNGMEAGVKVES